MKGSFTKFEFLNLPKVSKERVALEKAFPNPAIDVSSINDILSDVLETFKPIPAKKLSLALLSFAIESKHHTLRHFNKNSFHLFGNLSKPAIPFVLQADEQSVIDLVYLLMGSNTEIPSNKTALTKVEEGIFTFFLSLIFKAFENTLVEHFATTIHLDPFDRLSSMEEAFFSDSYLINFSLELEIENIRSAINILLPSRILLLLKTDVANPTKEAVSFGLQRAENFRLSACVNIGQIDLDPDQICSLQIGDIVLLESSNVKFDDKTLCGQVNCILGDPALHQASAQLLLSPRGKYCVQISDIDRISTLDPIQLRHI